HQRDAGGDLLRLIGVEPAARVAGINGAEAAGTGAHRAHQHDGGGARVPALADIRTLRLLAYGGEAVPAHRAAHEIVALTCRRPGTQPVRLAAQGLPIGRGARLDAVLDGAKALRRQVLLAAAHSVAAECGNFADHRDTFDCTHGLIFRAHCKAASRSTLPTSLQAPSNTWPCRRRAAIARRNSGNNGNLPALQPANSSGRYRPIPE